MPEPMNMLKQGEDPAVMVTLTISTADARAVHRALSTVVSLMDQVVASGEVVPPRAPLYGQRERLLAIGRSVDHKVNEEQRYAKIKPRCSCPCGRGTDPGCQVCP